MGIVGNVHDISLGVTAFCGEIVHMKKRTGPRKARQALRAQNPQSSHTEGRERHTLNSPAGPRSSERGGPAILTTNGKAMYVQPAGFVIQLANVVVEDASGRHNAAEDAWMLQLGVRAFTKNEARTRERNLCSH